MSDQLKFILLFLALFAFRTLFGLCHAFFSPDELQTYLIGLKWYCEGGWPYFGPDLIVTETGFYSQIPGPLEALLIGGPLHLLPIPEAPFLFLNLLTTGILAVWAWYLSERLPQVPSWFLFVWIALLPWNLQESANPINPSYLLIGSGLFFLGFLEAFPALSMGLFPSWLSFALMGFGIFWDMQFHQSWVLLPPFLLVAWVARFLKKKKGLGGDLAASAAGALPCVLLLVPTYLKFGWGQGTSGFHLASAFNLTNFLSFFTVLARFLSMPSQETLRFLLEPGAVHHLDFFKTSPWLWPFGLFLILMGWLQPLSLLVLSWLHRDKDTRTRTMIGTTLFALLLFWASFWFTSKDPMAHILYILMPLLMAFSLTLWAGLARRKWWRVLAVACLGVNILFQAGWMVHMGKTQSLYVDREKVVKAIGTKDYHLLGERRPGSHN
ncbi:MAG TPA: hypothetical protein VHE12_01130 [bacterium]|nr:hypothetical protein [bacterium]